MTGKITATHLVRVIETATKAVEKELTATSERQAERLERGLSINLNHDRFHVDVVPIKRRSQTKRSTSPA